MGSSLTNSVEVRSDPIGPPSCGREGLDAGVSLGGCGAGASLGKLERLSTLKQLPAVVTFCRIATVSYHGDPRPGLNLWRIVERDFGGT
jgi:hypothetical protein